MVLYMESRINNKLVKITKKKEKQQQQPASKEFHCHGPYSFMGNQSQKK